MNSADTVRVRFPPSPTGWCHVGTARMAVINFLFARKRGGTIVFRSEDTDRERSKPEFEQDIKEQLTWLGLGWDEFYRTSELVVSHQTAMQKLIDEDKAYVSTEESKKEPGVMMQVVRLRNSGKKVTFTDVIRGDITFDTTELGDFAIGRALDDPLYHLAVVVDDQAHGITHVIRGDDHISNTPRQILIQEALGYARPIYAHYPLHLGADRSKLSKRTGDVAVKSYREKGYLPEALLNYIATLGWTPPSGKEILSLDEMMSEFELTDLHKSGAVFDIEKLRWYNRQYLLALSGPDFDEYCMTALKAAVDGRGLPWGEGIARTIMPVIRERVSVSADVAEMAQAGELDLFFADPQVDPVKLPEKKSTAADARRHMQHALAELSNMNDAGWNEPTIKAALWDYATREGRGAVLWPLRYALSGRDKSPDPFTIAGAIGKEATLRRITNALAKLAV